MGVMLLCDMEVFDVEMVVVVMLLVDGGGGDAIGRWRWW